MPGKVKLCTTKLDRMSLGRRGGPPSLPPIGTPSSTAPRTPGRIGQRVSVGTSGRIAPPPAHNDVYGRKPRPQTEHNHASRNVHPALEFSVVVVVNSPTIASPHDSTWASTRWPAPLPG